MIRQVLHKLGAVPSWLTSRVIAQVWLSGCDSVGKDVRTFFHPHIENRGRIEIGNNVRLNSNWAPLELVTAPGGLIRIGNGVYLNYGTLISAHHRISIGSKVMVGN